jgi:hypothetical protein
MHILQSTTFLSNPREHHVAVVSFFGDTSRSTHTGDFLAFTRTSNDRLEPLIDLNSALIVQDSQRTLYSVRQVQKSGHNIIFSNDPGIELNGKSTDFIPFIQCPQTGL